MKPVQYIALFLPFAFWSANIAAFEISGNKWPGAKALFYIDIPGIAGTGVSFNSAFSDAINEWNNKTPFKFSVVQQSRDACSNDGLNGVSFSVDSCGNGFTRGTLAIAIRRLQSEILGPPSIVQTDIVINQNETFNVYDGQLVQFGLVGLDLKRIAVHELGHALGLEHSNISKSIMAPNIGNLFQLQADDIAGVEKLYSGVSNCQTRKFSFGVINNALDSSDCTVDKLTAGNSDASPIDLYQFDIANTTTFNFTMTSASLDSVLLVADADLRVIAFDNKSSKQCNSTLNTTLQPGSYYLLANTYDEQVNPACSITGAYQISTSFSSNSFLTFANNESLTGGPAFGTFSGGISANSGLSYGNQFKSTDAIDIHASIAIDSAHQGKPGFVVVAALFDGAIHLLNAAGQFVVYDSKAGPIEKAKSRILSAQENLEIATGLIPASLGISAIVVDFAVGYGVDSNPNEVYFHTTPLNLTVSP